MGYAEDYPDTVFGGTSWGSLDCLAGGTGYHALAKSVGECLVASFARRPLVEILCKFNGFHNSSSWLSNMLAMVLSSARGWSVSLFVAVVEGVVLSRLTPWKILTRSWLKTYACQWGADITKQSTHKLYLESPSSSSTRTDRVLKQKTLYSEDSSLEGRFANWLFIAQLLTLARQLSTDSLPVHSMSYLNDQTQTSSQVTYTTATLIWITLHPSPLSNFSHRVNA